MPDPTPKPHDKVVPKLTGADIELAAIHMGRDQPIYNSDDAARLVLAEIPGCARRSAGHYFEESWNDPWSDYTGYRGNRAPGPLNGYYEWAQDMGRKFLGNGSCAYLDMQKLEIALAETLSCFDHCAMYGAMLQIARDAMRLANNRLPAGQSIKLLANNGNGRASWGSHLNILLTRRAWNQIFTERLHYAAFLASFQCASILLTGAGKVGADRGAPARYQISARADWLGDGGMISPNTIADRPLLNSRDESLTSADSGLARLHCIFHDCGLCQTATVLQVFCMQIVCAMIEQEQVPARLILEDPIHALRAWSRDPELNQTAVLTDGSSFTAVDFLEAAFDFASRFVDAGRADGLVPHVGPLMNLLAQCIAALRKRDFDFLASRIDWVVKMRVLESAAVKHGLAWNSPAMRYLDLTYGSLDSEGIFDALNRAGTIQKLVGDGLTEKFIHEPPENTRAWLRGYIIRNAQEGFIDDIDWNRLRIRQQRVSKTGWTTYDYTELSLADPLRCTRQECESVLRDAPSLAEGIRALARIEADREAAANANEPTNANVALESIPS